MTIYDWLLTIVWFVWVSRRIPEVLLYVPLTLSINHSVFINYSSRCGCGWLWHSCGILKIKCAHAHTVNRNRVFIALSPRRVSSSVMPVPVAPHGCIYLYAISIIYTTVAFDEAHTVHTQLLYTYARMPLCLWGSLWFITAPNMCL